MQGSEADNHLEWLNSIGAATFVISTDRKVIFWNDACEVMTGIKSSQVLNTGEHWRGFYESARPCLADMVLDQDWAQKSDLYDHVQRASSRRRGLVARNWCHTPAGKKFLIFEATAIYDDDGDIYGVIETLSDATNLKIMEEKLQVFSRAISNSSSAIVIQEPDGRIEFVNPKYLEITGYSYEEVIDRSIADIRRLVNISEERIRESIWESGEWKGELQCRRKDGSLYWDRCSISSVLDESDEICHLVGVHEDVTHEYELTAQLNYEASHDPLTGLHNRREFERQATLLLSERTSPRARSHCLCFIDLDHFKVVNDSCGHAAGDELLRQVAQLLNKTTRKTDTVARLGGDEFAIILDNSELRNALRVTQSLIKAIQEFRFFHEEKSFKIGFSIGVVEFDNTVANLQELLRNADAACYAAKDLGRNRVHVYQEDNEELAKRHGEMRWITRIHDALENDGFRLYVQRIESLTSPQDLHHEVLIRMRDPQAGDLPPGAFLPAAERYQLVSSIDRWVVDEVFRVLEDNQALCDSVGQVSINLSGHSIGDATFHDYLAAKFEQSAIPGGKFCFEITETASISKLDLARELIERLKRHGCHFALDDFGSGLSSFGYLKHLPVDILKIDGVFIRDIAHDEVDLAMVKSIHSVAQILNLKTTAEFVEDEATKALLAEVGIDSVQGYGIGKPFPIEQLIAFHSADVSGALRGS
ncbi:MAG: EAL domain-containing protein [Pseudomonadota bacterium]